MGQRLGEPRQQYFVDGISFKVHDGVVLVELQGRSGEMDVLFPIHRFMFAVREAINLVDVINAENVSKVAPMCAACDKRDRCPPGEH